MHLEVTSFGKVNLTVISMHLEVTSSERVNYKADKSKPHCDLNAFRGY